MRSVKDSEDETEQKTGLQSQKININSTVNSPLRRSSRIKHIKNSPSPDDNQSMDVDIVGTPKKRATRSSLAAVTTDTPTKINTRAASKRVMRAVSESKSPLPVVRTTRRTRASSVDPESLSDQNRSQPGTPVKTHKQILSNSPIKKEDEKKIRIPYVRLDTTIAEIDELTNSGNSDTSPDKALRSQKSPQINKKQCIHEDNEKDNSDKITSSFVSFISPAPSESDEIVQLSEERDNIHDKHVDEITAGSETIPVRECKDKEDLLSNEDTTDEVSTKDNFSNLSNKKEYKLETINKNSPEIEKLLQNIHCELPPATKKVMKIKLDVESSDTSTEDQKGSPSNKEILNIINDTSIEINTQPITNEASSSTKCLTPMCANKSLSKKETKFTKNESSLNKRRHSKESIETTMKHDILFEEDNIKEKMDISASNESNEDNSAIQNTQPLNETEVEYVTSISPKRAERKHMWLKNSAKENLNRKSTNDIDDHIEKEKENLQLENQKNTNANTDPDVSTNLLHDTSSDNSNKKIIEKEIDIETISSPLLSKESENESEIECDLVLVNKKAWLAAENIKAAKEAESFEYDSDDTVLLKSQLDARTTNYDVKQLATINEEGSRDKKSLTMMEDKKIDYDNKALNFPKDKKRCVLKKRENSFSSSEDLAAAVNKSLTEYKANKSLNKSGDRSVSKLNKSGQTVAKMTERSFKTHDEPDEQIEDDTNELNRSSQINKKNTYLSKSMERRKSLNKSSTKDTPLKQVDMQNISINKSQLDHSKKKPDNKDTDLKKKLNKKRSLNKSQNKDENASKPEEQNSSNSINTKTSTEVNDDESDDSEVVVSVMDFGCKNYFKRMHKSPVKASLISTPDKMLDNSDEDESKSPKLVMINSDTETSTSTHSNSDIKREYNLDGVEEKFSDDNIPGDECRASESEDSDPDDNGSDLADFIVNDNEIEKKENNDDDDEEEKEESNNEGEKEENIEEIRDVEEENEDLKEGEDEGENEGENEGEDEDAEEEQSEDAEEEQSEDAEEKKEEAGDAEEEVDDESENEQNVKEKDKVAKKKKIDKKSNMAKNKTIVLDTSNSDSSIKNKSMQKNEDILLDTSSNLSAKKKKKSEVQFSKNVKVQKLIEQIKAEERQHSHENELLKHSTPKLDTYKKFEFYETLLEENLEIEDTNKSGNTKTIQNTSLKKKELEIKDRESKRTEEIHKKAEAELNEQKCYNVRLAEEKKYDTFEYWRFKNFGISGINCTGLNAPNTESPKTSFFQSNRCLGKKKLNESAPELGADILKKTSVKQTKHIAQTETKLESDEKEISNLVTPLNDETVQKSDRKKQKKRKTSVNDISGENIIDLPLIQAMRESEVPKKKKYTKLATDIIVEDDTCKDTHQINEKEKKPKKRKLQIIEQSENVNEVDVLQKNIRKNTTKFIQHKDQNYKAKDVKVDLTDYRGSYPINEQIKPPKMAENQELIMEKLFREMKEEEKKKTSQLEVGTSTLKSDQNPSSDESENTAFAKAWDNALQITHDYLLFKANDKKALKKKREDDKNTIQKQRVLKSPDKKQRKQVIEKNDCLPSTSRVKRLSDDVLENLPDQPMKAKKKQKISQSQERITSSGHSSGVMTVKDDKNSFTLSTSGSTTKFTVVDLSKTKKLSSSKAAASFRERLLARNSEPVSAYMMYLEKQKATANSRSSRKAF